MNEFCFTDCIEIKELTGKKAEDEAKLMELIEEAPADSIYYHTHSYFLRHFYIAGPFPNDFANWAGIQVRDKVLGEQLASITPSNEYDLEMIRMELVDIIDRHLSSLRTVPSVIFGQPFYFMKSKIIEVQTDVKVRNLKEFRDALKNIDASAIYNHIFEARMRIRRGKTDFSIWLEEVLGLHELASRIEMMDSYMYSLEGLRKKILSLCDLELAKG